MATKDEIRAAIFSRANFKKEVFNFLGQDVELRQPTVGQIGKLADDKNNQNRLIEIIIESAYVKSSNDEMLMTHLLLVLHRN